MSNGYVPTNDPSASAYQQSISAAAAAELERRKREEAERQQREDAERRQRESYQRK